MAQVQQIAGQLERSLAEAHGEKQRLEEVNAEQAALIPALQQACKAAEGQVSTCTLKTPQTPTISINLLLHMQSRVPARLPVKFANRVAILAANILELENGRY